MRTARAVAFVIVLCAASVAQQRVTPTARPEDAATIRDFQAHISHYISMRDHLTRSDSSPQSAAEAVAKRDRLAKAVQSHRNDARQGDLFTPQATEFFKRQLRATLDGPNGKRIRLSLAHAEPVRGFRVQVDEPYPDATPLQSTPPTLLLNLPRLPKGLEYRFVGRDLTLYDAATNLIVDFIPNALPESAPNP